MKARCPAHNNFDFGNLHLSSDFDSGNLRHADKISNAHFALWINPDHPDNQVNSSVWEGTITFTVKNMGNHVPSLQAFSQFIITKASAGKESKLQSIWAHQGLQFTFKHFLHRGSTYVAFCYPWSTEDSLEHILQLEKQVAKNRTIYFKKSCITHSKEGREVILLTVSDHTKITAKSDDFDKDLFPNGDRPSAFQKRSVLITARVHPGQVPSSHVMTGVLNFLCSEDERARLLRQNFVFYLIPILNPDGVFRGHYRTDVNGVNLNRYYINPSPTQHSPVYAAKKLVLHLHSQGRLHICLDLHAHAAKKGFFIYGNCSSQLQTQLDICLFPKLLSMNNKDFQYEGSNFTEQNMYIKDKADKFSKEGSARVAFFKKTKNPKCWTIQCNYNMSRYLNTLSPRVSECSPQTVQRPPITLCSLPKKDSSEFYNLDSYYRFGQNIMETILDLQELHPNSRLPNTPFGSLQGLTVYLSAMLLRMQPFRFQNQFRKVLNNLNSEDPSKGIEALGSSLHLRKKILNLQDYLKGKDPVLEVERQRIPSINTSKRVISNSLPQNRQRDKDYKSQLDCLPLVPIKEDDLLLPRDSREILLNSYLDKSRAALIRNYIQKRQQTGLNSSQQLRLLQNKNFKIVTLRIEAEREREPQREMRLNIRPRKLLSRNLKMTS